MQYDCLGPDQVSVIRNREVSLIQRSCKYMFQYGTVNGRPYNGGVLNLEGRNRGSTVLDAVRNIHM